MTSFKSLFLSLLITGLALWITGCGGSGGSEPAAVTTPPPAPPTQPQPLDYQALIDQAVANGVTGITLLVESPEERFVGSAGLADKASMSPMAIDSVMPTGSAGKTITAVLALLLQQDGMLNLDDPISNWLDASLLDQIAFSRQMTMRQLLNHTSGIYEYLHNPQFALDIVSNPDLQRLDEQVISYAFNQPASFAPGGGFEYSNTGYVLAGLVLDEVLGFHHSQAVRERILDPLGMTSTFYLGAEGSIDDIISGYRALSDLGLSEDEEVQNVKPLLYNLGVGDAPVASTVEDYLLYQKALGEVGSFLSEEATQEMIGDEFIVSIGSEYHLADSVLSYGLGMFKETAPGMTLYHHDGDQFGWLTYNIIWEEEQMSIILMTNCGGELCEQETANVVHTILNQ